MGFLGSLEFAEGRSVNKTTTMVLERCLGCGNRDQGKAIAEFLTSLRIQPDAFFRDIQGDWSGRPFLGEHVFKIVQAAGYEGTEHDLWTTVTGYPAPYPVKSPKALAKNAEKSRLKKAASEPVATMLKARVSAAKAAKLTATRAPKAKRTK